MNRIGCAECFGLISFDDFNKWVVHMKVIHGWTEERFGT